MKQTIEQALQDAVVAHKNGRLGEAERLYSAILQSQPEHPDANHNLGIIAVSANKVGVALPLFKTALEVNPKIEQFWVSYIDALIKDNQIKNAKRTIIKGKKKGFNTKKLEALLSQSKASAGSAAPSQAQLKSLLEQFQNGRFDEAEKSAVSLSIQFPSHNFSWKLLGAIFKQTGRNSESLAAMQKCVEIAPQDPEASNNLGVMLQELSRLEEAEVSYKKAIALKPDYALAYSNLGNTLKEQDRLDEAEACYRKAIALKPDYAQAHSDLGAMLQELDRRDEAIGSYKEAININPDYIPAYTNMAFAIQGVQFKQFIPDLPEIIFKILERKTLVRPLDIEAAAISLLNCDPAIQSALRKSSVEEIALSLQKNNLSLFNIPLLLKLMHSCPITNLKFETFFKNIRTALLLNISNVDDDPDILKLQIAIASQCFINEYLFDVTDEEAKALKILEDLIEENIKKGQQVSAAELAVLASYKALNQYSFCHLLNLPIELEVLQRTQIVEPELEKQIKLEIPTLQEITNNVSSKVREQYTHNPYPRWVELAVPSTSKSISTVVNDIKLRITDLSASEIKKPKILIGGCGTGQHAIETATRFKDCDVLAVDLSLSSLAYARRKTEELGLTNIEYMQADILDLGSLNRQFDIVESAGVLHHMEDPMAGWKVLTDCLKPGGLMKIGLYSELARKNIVQMRHEIQELSIDSGDAAMKLFRQHAVNSEKNHHKDIVSNPDFYCLSGLRDLLFHVQEHRFTITEIKESLAQLDLDFCGFEFRSDKKVDKFKSQNIAQNAIYDLDKWDVFEKENPTIFFGMYQFWCQKLIQIQEDMN